MSNRFEKHYTLDEARRLLPQLRRWLKQLVALRSQLEERDTRLGQLRQPGTDLGGQAVNEWVRTMAEIKGILLEFYQRDIQIKDLERGLIDFPALREGKEVFLCWEQAESDIAFWHDLDSGYAGRQPLQD